MDGETPPNECPQPAVRLILRPRRTILEGAGVRRAFSPGATARLIRAVGEFGVPLQILDEIEPNPRLVLDRDVLKRVAPHSQRFLLALLEHRRGQIVAESWSERIRMIALAARAYAPAAYVSVMAGSRKDARRAASDLRLICGPSRVALHIDGIAISETQVQVCTYSYVYKWRADLTFYIHAEEAVTRRGRDALCDFGDDGLGDYYDQHVFGFTSRRPAKRVDARELESILGPIVYEPEQVDPGRTVVQVIWTSPPGKRRDMPRSLEEKRREIYRNRPRNDHIAQLASVGEPGGTFGFEEWAGPRPRPFATSDRPIRVAILVELPEHGRELAALLPGWPTFTRNDKPATIDLPARAIVTHMFVASCPNLDYDVLIRVDGDAKLPDMPGFPPRPKVGEPRTVWLVDPADGDVARRTSAYHKQGWYVAEPAVRDRQ